MALMIASGLMGLMVAELALRSGGTRGDEWMLANSPELYDVSIFGVDDAGRLGLRPGRVGRFHTLEFQTSVAVNALGLRGPELVPLPAEEDLVVLTVGDSITLAVQVGLEQTFQARLQTALSSKLGRSVHVLNGGVDSHGTWDAQRQLERVAESVPLDAVVLTCFTGNDLQDNCMSRGHHRKGQGHRPPPPALSGFLRRWSYLYSWGLARQAASALATDPERAGRYRDELAIYMENGSLDRWLGCSREALGALARECSRRDLACIVGVAPPSFAVHEERLGPTLELVGLSPEQARVALPGERVVALVPEGMVGLDLLPALLAASERQMYFEFDGHWTAAGHEVVASAYEAAVFDALEQRR
jgi:hypothetical protein